MSSCKPSQIAVATQGYVGLIILSLWIVLGLGESLRCWQKWPNSPAMFPRSGGSYLGPQEACGPLWAFSWAWAEFCIIRSGVIATLAAAMANAFGELAEETAAGGGPPTAT